MNKRLYLLLDRLADKSNASEIETTDVYVSGITVSRLMTYVSAGVCMVTVELTLDSTFSSWTQIASGLPVPATALLETPVAWYDTGSGWDSSFKRNLRFQVGTSGNLYVRYGEAGSYRISFAYPTAEWVGSGGGGGGGGGGTTDYNDLTNKPSINGITLQGDVDPADFLPIWNGGVQ